MSCPQKVCVCVDVRGYEGGYEGGCVYVRESVGVYVYVREFMGVCMGVSVHVRVCVQEPVRW